MTKFNRIALAILASQVATSGYVLADESKGVEVKTKGGLEVKAGDYSIKFGGRIQWDYNYASLNDVTDEDDFSIRRARIYASGDLGDDWSYKAQFNIGDSNGGTPEDLYIQYKGWEAGTVTIGKQKVMFGLEEVTSSKDITALERSGITEQYVAGRQHGIGLNGKIGSALYFVSAFEDDDAPGDDDFGIAGRVVFNPVMDDEMMVHVGLGYMSRGGDATTSGLELAANMGSFSIQSEFFDGDVEGENIDGYYIQAGYILTGETRPYRGGKFRKVKPGSDGGAWEIFARIEEGDGNHSDIELGRVDASAYSVGVNYYVNNAVRIGMNYSQGDSNVPGSSDEGEEFRVRFQIAY
jgi:phosphate-selective porin OprO/OprP